MTPSTTAARASRSGRRPEHGGNPRPRAGPLRRREGRLRRQFRGRRGAGSALHPGRGRRDRAGHLGGVRRPGPQQVLRRPHPDAGVLHHQGDRRPADRPAGRPGEARLRPDGRLGLAGVRASRQGCDHHRTDDVAPGGPLRLPRADGPRRLVRLGPDLLAPRRHAADLAARNGERLSPGHLRLPGGRDLPPRGWPDRGDGAARGHRRALRPRPVDRIAGRGSWPGRRVAAAQRPAGLRSSQRGHPRRLPDAVGPARRGPEPTPCGASNCRPRPVKRRPWRWPA